MKVEFEGTLDEIYQEIVKLLNSHGLKVVPFDEERGTKPEEVSDDADTALVEEKPAQKAAAKERPSPRKKAKVDAPEETLNGTVPHDEEDKDDDNDMGFGSDPDLNDPVALNKLKQETLKRLRDLYVAGKGNFVRQLLAKHGHGAIVFPEVDAQYFPAIKADLEKELN